MNELLVSIKIILDKINRHPLLSDVSLETAIDYCVDLIRIVGAPQIFLDKVVSLVLKDYKVSLPLDFIEVIQIRTCKNQLRASTDSFHLSDTKNATDDTFVISGGYIQSNIENGEIEVAYRSIATDEYGLPMIPDNSNFTRALEAYIKLQHFGILFDLGKINTLVMQKAQLDYAFFVGSLETDARRLDLPKAEAFYNMWNTLLVRSNEYKYGFANNGIKETFYKK